MSSPLLAALVSSVCWGGAWFFSARVSRQAGSLNALFLFQLLGVPYLVLLYPWRPAVETAPPWPLFFGLAAMACTCMGMFFQAMRVGNLALVTPISQTAPVVTALLGAIFVDHQIGGLQLGAIGVVLMGVMLLSLARQQGATRFLAGVPLALGAAVGAGVYLLFCATTARESGWYWTSLGIRLGMVFWLGLIVLPRWRRWWKPFPVPFWRDALMSAGLDVAAFSIYNHTVSQAQVWYVAGVVCSQSLVTVLLAAVFLKERLTPRQAVGLALVLLGLVGLQSGVGEWLWGHAG